MRAEEARRVGHARVDVLDVRLFELPPERRGRGAGRRLRKLVERRGVDAGARARVLDRERRLDRDLASDRLARGEELAASLRTRGSRHGRPTTRQ